MGSELVDVETGTLLWGLSARRYASFWTDDSPWEKLKVTDDERTGKAGRVRATRLLRFPGFAPVLRGIEPYSRLTAGIRDIVLHPAALLEYPYDWRLSVAHNAAQLATCAGSHLERWRRHPDGRPDAKLVLVAANPAETQGVQGFDCMFKGEEWAIQNFPGAVISQSFAVTEQSFHSAADVQVARFDKIYQDAVARRMTIIGATGDTGTANPDKQGRVFAEPTVNWPSSDPLVTAAGGTWLQYGWKWDPTITANDFYTCLNTAADPTTCYGQYLSYDNNPGVTTEAVWKEDWAAAATGGGRSVLFPTPSFQSGIASSLLQGSRGVPDISWNAAINGGVLTYIGFLGEASNGYYIIGGTSAATPQLAGVVAGQFGQAVALHHGNDQCIATEQAMLAAEIASQQHLLGAHWQDVNANAHDFVQGLARFHKSVNFTAVAAQALPDTGIGPAEQLTRLQSHQPIGDVVENSGGDVAGQIVGFAPLEQGLAGGPEHRVRTKIVNENVGVQEYRITRGKVGEVHGDSRTPNSSSAAIFRRISGSPVQPISP